jgi:putative spermidine/putrescine transport system ATP-binding protein
MIAGFDLPTQGNIVIDGEDVTYRPPNLRHVGMVFQSYALFPNLSVADNIGFGLQVNHRPKAEISQRVKEMLEIINLPDHADRYPYQLSGGQQQRIALARALAIRPHVLLLDEPLSALDAKIRVRLRAEIRDIQQKLGITTIYVTHDQEEALSLSDRVVVMNEGHIEQIGTPFEIYNFPRTPFVASFVGTLNILDACVVAAGDGKLSVDGQEVMARCSIQGVREDGTVKLALRPEMLSLTPGAEDENSLETKVEKISFLGSIVRVQDLLQTSRLFFDMFNNPNLKLPAPGDAVKVYFPREACLALSADVAV